jgi:hypothetical protein
LEGTKSTSVLSFSIDLNSLNYLDSYATLNRCTMSAAIRYHLKMGRIYLKILDEQQETTEMSVTGAQNVEQ